MTLNPLQQFANDLRYDWQKHAQATLAFLYGPDHQRERAARTAADLAAWRSLGEPKGDAA